MIPSWFLFAMGSVLVWSVGAILVKFIRINYIKSPIGYVMLSAPIGVLTIFLLFFEKLHVPSFKMMAYIFLSGMTAMTGYWFYLVAVHKEEISRVATLEGLEPAVMLIASTIFLGEILTLNDYLAFPLVIAGSMLISVRKIEKKFKISQGMYMVFLSMFFFVISGIFFKLTAELNFTTVMIWREVWIILGALLVILFSKQVREKTKLDFSQLRRKKLLLFYLAETCGIGGLFLTFLALQRGPISLVVLVQSTQTLFIIAIASLISIFLPRILKEEITKKTLGLKIISALLMIAGLYLIVM